MGVLGQLVFRHGTAFVIKTVQDGAIHLTGGRGQVIGTWDSVAV